MDRVWEACDQARLHEACIRSVVTMLLSFLVIAGSMFVRLPQIVAILKQSSVAGLSSITVYNQLALLSSKITYHFKKGAHEWAHAHAHLPRTMACRTCTRIRSHAHGTYIYCPHRDIHT